MRAGFSLCSSVLSWLESLVWFWGAERTWAIVAQLSHGAVQLKERGSAPPHPPGLALQVHIYILADLNHPLEEHIRAEMIKDCS